MIIEHSYIPKFTAHHTSPGPATRIAPASSITRAIAVQTHCAHAWLESSGLPLPLHRPEAVSQSAFSGPGEAGVGAGHPQKWKGPLVGGASGLLCLGLAGINGVRGWQGEEDGDRACGGEARGERPGQEVEEGGRGREAGGGNVGRRGRQVVARRSTRQLFVYGVALSGNV
ncbi:hypothetical protein BC826DRAFT_982921 [Russula brevipes]|nr:hypothetical protein BC826DRAFT_982921 [Russula brevipes]